MKSPFVSNTVFRLGLVYCSQLATVDGQVRASVLLCIEQGLQNLDIILCTVTIHVALAVSHSLQRKNPWLRICQLLTLKMPQTTSQVYLRSYLKGSGIWKTDSTAAEKHSDAIGLNLCESLCNKMIF